MSESGTAQHNQRSSKSASSEPASISSKSSNHPATGNSNLISKDRDAPPKPLLDPPAPSPSLAATTISASSTNAATTPTPRTPFTPSSSTTVSIPSQRPQFRLPASPRSAVMTPEDPSKAAKVAIPRLKRSLDSGDVATKPGGRHRVTHACEPCRHRKTKCSGERPTCRHCQDFKIQCYYADGKRDRVKKQFGSMAEKVSDYERILRDLQTRVSEEDANLIRNSLDRAAMLDGDDVQTEPVQLAPLDNDAASEVSGAESEVSGRAGSTGALDKTDEDFTREGAKATGFMGKNSDVTWMQRLRHENKHGDTSAISSLGQPFVITARGETDIDVPETELGAAVQDSSYHLNDLAISTFEAVDPFEMPTQDHARSLFSTYMTRVHPSFPVVGRINLQNQFNKFLARPMNRPPQKWLAIINMIFAIAAKLSHLIQADWQADERDHLIYFTRARLLSIDTDTLFNHADLQSIQIFGLMSFYLMAVEQTNRAWSLIGLSIRHATSLGLNMRNESPDLTDGLKEIRYRVWWALYTLEHRLCTLTGRVGCIHDDHCTTPLPVPVLEEDFDTDAGRKLLNSENQRSMRAPSLNSTPPSNDAAAISRSGSKEDKANSRSPSVQNSQQSELEWAKDVPPNSALFFLHYVQLCRITQATLQQLYNPQAVMGKWSDLQTSMQGLNQRAENWYRALPTAFDFGRKQRDRDLYDARLALGFYYYSTKQIINRPCLCRLDQKIPGQSEKSNEFNHASALACVNAAREQLDLIPDEPNGVGLLRVGPWMTMVHLLVQSCTVLMLELSFRAHHMPDQVDGILAAAKKAVRWLHALAEDNLAAARAWRLCNSMLTDSARKVGGTTDDMPKQPPKSYYESPNSDMNLSSSAGTYDMDATHSQIHAKNHDFSQQHLMQPMTTSQMQGYANFTAFDQNMHYNPYFQPFNANPSGMPLPQSQAQTQAQHQGQGGIGFAATMPEDLDMNFNTYFDHNHDTSDAAGGNTGGPGMSGFG